MPCRLTRRQFNSHSLRAAAAGAAAPLFASSLCTTPHLASAENKLPSADTLPIIDPHQHLLYPSKFRMLWADSLTSKGNTFTLADYHAAAQGLNIVKTVYMEVDVVPEQQSAEAECVIEICKQRDSRMVGAVISGRPATDDFAACIGRFKNSPYIKGVREILHSSRTPPGFCLGEPFVRSIRLLGEMGLSFDLCMRPDELLDGDKLVAQCPQTRFVVDHCGNLSPTETDTKKRRLWMDGLKALAQRDNVVCKISGIVASAPDKWTPADLAPNLSFAMETFGPDRRIFASDWPVCTLRATLAQWVRALQTVVAELGMSVPDQRKLFHDNAAKFYGV